LTKSLHKEGRAGEGGKGCEVAGKQEPGARSCRAAAAWRLTDGAAQLLPAARLLGVEGGQGAVAHTAPAALAVEAHVEVRVC